MNDFFRQNLQRWFARHLNNARIARMALRVLSLAPQPRNTRPVVFFKASSGLDDLSWNSGFHLLASWALRLQGIPVAYFACQAGMSRCVLGTDRDNPHKTPPCRSCIYQARTLYTGTQVYWFNLERSTQLENALKNLPLTELMAFEWPFSTQAQIASGEALAMTIPLGALVLPGLRWILRIHHLNDDENTRFLLREYILSAWNVARQFERILEKTNPQAVIVFNGQFFPEATARWVARQRGLKTIAHEVGLQPATAFFTEGEATAYPIHIPDEFEMNAEQNARLDAYLEKRFQGQFTMAGIKFWAEMKGLDASFLARAASFKQIVPIFTNVIFDTSQPHANTVFEDMFTWLDTTLEVIRAHPETLFVIRAHPDELRVRKASRETVAAWVEASGADKEPNVIFVAPNEPLSSYELILKSKFVLVYNSTIGLEAAIMGAAVLCAGRARFTQYPTVFFPPTVAEVKAKMEEFLAAEKIEIPVEFQRNARRFLYYQLFRTSLPFGDFLETGIRTTHAKLKWFDPRDLLNAPAIQTVTNGLLENGDFLLEE